MIFACLVSNRSYQEISAEGHSWGFAKGRGAHLGCPPWSPEVCPVPCHSAASPRKANGSRGTLVRCIRPSNGAWKSRATADALCESPKWNSDICWVSNASLKASFPPAPLTPQPAPALPSTAECSSHEKVLMGRV